MLASTDAPGLQQGEVVGPAGAGIVLRAWGHALSGDDADRRTDCQGVVISHEAHGLSARSAQQIHGDGTRPLDTKPYRLQLGYQLSQ
jgi:hypothetical protein